MSFPESFSPRGGTAASGPDPMPGAFTGQARDLPAPFEFPPVPAVQLLASRPAVTAPARKDETKLEPETLLMPPEPPMVPAETAFRLQELASALARPVAAPVAVPVASDAAEFSLTALANQLQTRFSEADPAAGEGVDLLEKLPSQPAPKPASPRQGDVFFMERAVVPREMELPGRPDKVDLFGDAPPAGTNADVLDAMDLMDAPDLLEESPPVPPRVDAPFLPPPLPAASLPEMPSTPAEGGLGLVLGGTGLILLGIYFACLLPSFWLTLEGADAWTRQKTQAALVLHTAAALTMLVLGTGSVLARRWAPPLIHAAGWVTVLTVSGIIAATGFHLVNADADAPVPDPASLLQLLAALLLPLGCIFYYQQESTAAVCEAADPVPAWTDHLPIPAPMVFLTGLAIAAGAAAMLCHQPAFSPATGPVLTGPGATAAWAALGVTGLATAVSVRLKHAAALWLLLLTALTLTATLSPAALPAGPVWENFLAALGRPATAGPAAPLVPLLTALIPAPLLLIFAMARRAFSPPPPP